MKLCKNCKHAIAGEAVIFRSKLFGTGWSSPWMCRSPSLVDPVTGGTRECITLRLDGALCGPFGEFWEEGEPTKPEELKPARL